MLRFLQEGQCKLVKFILAKVGEREILYYYVGDLLSYQTCCVMGQRMPLRKFVVSTHSSGFVTHPPTFLLPASFPSQLHFK